MKILIITFFFPPLNRIASSRPYSWAKYWSRMGHEVSVLTKFKTTADGALNLEYHLEDLKDVKIYELKAWPFRLKRPAPETAADSKKRNTRWFRIKAYLQALRVIGYSDFWGFSAIKKLNRKAKSFPFDVVISTYGPSGSHIIASLIKKRFKTFWAADYRDLWHGNHARPKKWPFNLIEDKLEKYFVNNADLIITVSEGFKNRLAKRLKSDVITIENGFDEEDMPRTTENEKFFPDDGKFRIAYMGTIYKGWQDPSALFEALVLLREKGFPVESKVELLFYGSKLGGLEKLICSYSLEKVIKTPGYVSRKDSLIIQRSVDALLFLEWSDPAIGEGLLNAKIYEYLYSGRPILSIGGSSNTELVNLLETSGAGLALGKSPQIIADFLEKMLNGQSFPYTLSEEKLAYYSRKFLAAKLLSVITKRATGLKG